MTDGEQQGAFVLSEQEEVELRQLSELILGTEVVPELYRDIFELAEPVLDLVRNHSEELEYPGWGSKDAWASFTVYLKLDGILRDLLLGARDEDADPDIEDRELTEAAAIYGLKETLEEQMAIGDLDGEDPQPLCREELESFQSAIEDKIGASVELDELAELVGSSVPDFAQDARSHSWSDPAVVEAATNFYLDSLGPSALSELLGEPAEDDYPITEAERESFVQKLGELIEGRVHSAERDLSVELEEEFPEDYAPRVLTDVEELVVNDPEVIATHAELEAHPELWTVADDLSPEDEPTDTSDEGEWGVAEISAEDESEAIEDFTVEEVHGDHGHSGLHAGHVHQILGDELRGLDDYDGEPADEREIATLALIAEGIIYAEISEILLQDLVAEADPLIRKSRALGPDWWMTIEAADDVANLISVLLLDRPWPNFAPHTSDEELRREGNAHQAQLRRLAESYPLDPEPTRDEKLASLTPAERYELLLEERGERAIPLGEDDIDELKSIIEDVVGRNPTPPLVTDLGKLISGEAMKNALTVGFRSAVSSELQRLAQELLLGKSYEGSVEGLPAERSEELSAAVQSYRTAALTEEEFLKHYDQSRWPSVGATVDLSIFTILDGKLQVLLIERGNHPELGKWALPGGFVDTGESIDSAALRELEEETGVNLSEGGYIEQVRTYGYPGRDRRGYIISTLYAALLPEAPAVLAGDDAAKARFVPVDEALSGELELAFDHAVLLRDALERIRAKLEYSPIVFDFLPAGGFTLSELRGIYETVWGFEILPSDFFRRITQAEGALSSGDPGKFTRGPAETFFPPLDRRQVVPRD